MRPYGSLKKDDGGKYVQPNTMGIQPSPLALLAATCSRIGDTFPADSSPVFTQKNLTTFLDKKIHDSIGIRSCAVESKLSDLNYFQKGQQSIAHLSHQPPQLQYHQQQFMPQQQNSNISPTYPVQSNQIPSSCFKIKSEQESIDCNQNFSSLDNTMHICPNIINDTRSLENQARASFKQSCCHESIPSPTSCVHQSSSPAEEILHTKSSCQHELSPQRIPSPANSSHSSSCLYQLSPTSVNQSSCAVESMKYQTNTLSHLPTTQNSLSTNSTLYSNSDNFGRYKSPPINPWQNQNVHRITSSNEQPKSSCMLHDNFSSTSNAQIMSSHSQERSYRSYSPPNEQERHQFNNFQRPEYSSHPSVEGHHPSPHYTGTQSTPSPHNQQQSPFNNFGSTFDSMDVKPDPYTLQQQQNMRQQQAAGLMSTVPYASHESHPHTINTMDTPTTPEQLGLPPNLQAPNYPLAHNHPAGMTSYSCSACNITNTYQANFASLTPQAPDSGVNVPNPMAGPTEMAPHYAAAEYQYQQQQLYYSRDNRRPRRIACTCPNCRDGENKTVTTKDGKQKKLHVCHIPGCGKIYGKTSHLRAHLRWHAGERPFACNWLFCNKRFTRSDELQRHRRTHTGDKRFECSICNKKFMRSDHLSKHMKTHQSQQNKQQNKDKQNSEKNCGSEKTAKNAAKITASNNNNNMTKKNSELTSKHDPNLNIIEKTTTKISNSVMAGITESLTL